jgi:putative peptidoglycan lipid II flippase
MTLAVKVVTFGKEAVMAARLGTSDELDAFLVAFIIPSFAANVVATSLGAALTPIYVELRDGRSRDEANQLVGELMLWAVAAVTLVMVGLTLAGPVYVPLVASGFTADKRDLVQSLLWLLIPMVAMGSLRTLWGAVLNVGERFALMSAVVGLTPAITGTLLLVMPGLGVYALVVGFTVGPMLEVLILGIALKREGVSLRPRWNGYHKDLHRVVNQWWPMIAGAVLMASSAVVDQIMAAALEPGSVSALEYGNRLVGVVTGMGSTALGVAVVPYFSQLAANGQWTSLRNVVRQWLRLSWIVSVPVVIVLAVFSEKIVQFVFQRGAFSADDTQLVSDVQFFLALQIPFYVAGMILVRLVSALKANQALAWISVSNTVINVVLNLLFMRIWGLSGIALATSCMYAGSFFLLWWYVSRRWPSYPA